MLFSGTSVIQLRKSHIKLGKGPNVASELRVGHLSAIVFSISEK